MTVKQQLAKRPGAVGVVIGIMVSKAAVERGDYFPASLDPYVLDALREWDAFWPTFENRTEADVAARVVTMLRADPHWGKVLREGTQ